MSRPPVGRHQVRRGGLEGLDEFAEFLLLHAARQPCETDQVGEADGETAVDHLLVVRRLHDPAGGRGELAAPDVDEELLQLGQEQFDQGVRHLGARHSRFRGLGQALQKGIDLPFGQTGGGLPGGPGDLDRHGLAQQARLDETGEPAQGEHVRLGQRLGLADVREAHRPPEAGGQLHGDARAAGRLERGVPPLGAEDQPLQAQRERVLPRVRLGLGVHPAGRLVACVGPDVRTGVGPGVAAAVVPADLAPLVGAVVPVEAGSRVRAVVRAVVRAGAGPGVGTGVLPGLAVRGGPCGCRVRDRPGGTARLAAGGGVGARAGAGVVDGHSCCPSDLPRSGSTALNSTAGVRWLTPDGGTEAGDGAEGLDHSRVQAVTPLTGPRPRTARHAGPRPRTTHRAGPRPCGPRRAPARCPGRPQGCPRTRRRAVRPRGPHGLGRPGPRGPSGRAKAPHTGRKRVPECARVVASGRARRLTRAADAPRPRPPPAPARRPRSR